MLDNFLCTIELDNLWFKPFYRRKGFGAQYVYEGQMKSLYILFTALQSNYIGRYRGYWVR